MPLASAETLAELSQLRAVIEGGSGRMWIELSVDEQRWKEVRQLLRSEGYELVEEP